MMISATAGVILRAAVPTLRRMPLNTLSELPVPLRPTMLNIPNKIASRATYEDAEILARYEGLVPKTVAHSDFIAEAMAAD